MSQLKVNALVSYSGNTVTLGTSGDTINVASGVTFNTASATVNYPAGSITNAAINASAAIAYSKLNLSNSIVNADIASNAAIATTKLGAGAVLQVVTATDSTERSTSSASFVTGSNTLSVSITPSSASNKIFIITNTAAGNDGNALTIFRDATNLGNGTAGMAFATSGVSACISVLDSPNTTSSITYQLYFRSTNGSTQYINNITGKGSITVFEIAG
jgi:hypothetical protein